LGNEFGQPGLQFQGGNLDPGVAVAEDQGDHPAARPQIKNARLGPGPDKMGQQHGVHRESVARPMLPAGEKTAKKGILGYLGEHESYSTFSSGTILLISNPVRIFG
jgi:hypothetical protein